MRISDWSSDVCSSDLRSVLRRVGAGDRAENLRHGPLVIPRRTGPGATVRRLFLEARPGDRPPVEARRRPGLEPRHRQIGGAELLREAACPGFADAAALHPLLAAKHPAAEEGAGGEPHRPPRQPPYVAACPPLTPKGVGEGKSVSVRVKI